MSPYSCLRCCRRGFIGRGPGVRASAWRAVPVVSPAGRGGRLGSSLIREDDGRMYAQAAKRHFTHPVNAPSWVTEALRVPFDAELAPLRANNPELFAACVPYDIGTIAAARTSHQTHRTYIRHRPFCFKVENQMVSAERVLGYCKVSQEASLESEPAGKPSDDWPAKGGIEVCKKLARGTHTSARPPARASQSCGWCCRHEKVEARCHWRRLVSPLVCSAGRLPQDVERVRHDARKMNASLQRQMSSCCYMSLPRIMPDPQHVHEVPP